MSIKNKIIVTAIVVVSFCITGILGYSIVKDVSDQPIVTVYANEILVAGEYGEAIPLSNAEVTLVNEPIKVTMRKSGVSQDASLKGRYSVKGIDSSVFVSILNKENSYILIKNQDGVYALNLETNQKTQSLYREILNASKK
ncbi:MAG: hypothetical protein RR327_05680 [Clostridia bacterium]